MNYYQYHNLSFKNKEIIRDLECGCFQCIKTFHFNEIKHFTDNEKTALCPFCDINSVIPVTDINILKEMQFFWFSNKNNSSNLSKNNLSLQENKIMKSIYI